VSDVEVVGGFRLAWASRTDVGKVRKVNEDSVLARPGLFIVADGMGGHAAGDIASQLTIQSFDSAMSEPTLLPIGELAGVVSSANAAVIEQSVILGREGMGSTVVGAAVVDNGGDAAIVVFHVGDSRCYVLNDGQLRQVTHDHSHVQELIDSGDITDVEALTHPHRNVVTRAVGIEPAVLADFLVLGDNPRQRLLLCSDGVSGDVHLDALEYILLTEDSVDDAADEIMRRTLSGKAKDNASVIVVDVEREPTVNYDVDLTGPRITRLPVDEWAPPTETADTFTDDLLVFELLDDPDRNDEDHS
jgi:PPM family protein phosphatase